MHSTEGRLKPYPPFDFDKSMEFVAGFAPTQKDHKPAIGEFTRALSIGGQVVAFQLTSTGSVEEPELQYRLLSEQPLDDDASRKALERIAFYLSLDDDLEPFYRIGREDPLFAPVVERLYGYHQVKLMSPFEAGCWAVLTQRNAMSEARKMRTVLVKRYGGSIEVEGTLHWAFPEAAHLAVANPSDLGAIADNERKGDYLQALARAFDDVSEEFLLSAPYAEVEAWLRGIKGVGEWTAAFILLRGLGRTERVPMEKHTLTAISRVYGGGKALSEAEAKELAGRYGAWQGYWAHYLRAASQVAPASVARPA
ncbi:MAG TPA: DNA-3-methyladenine glycosylase 2 family protein [Chloroflexia bacterium]